MKQQERIQKKSSQSLLMLILIILSIIPLLDLFHPGLPITHDGQDHVARIANFYQNLQDGNFIPRWAGNLNWGYGHPVLMFLYPLPSYLASLFHSVGVSFVDSVKIVFGVTFILSGLAMYLWLQAFLPRTAALVGGLLYLFAPYRFIDLYVRGAIGEHVAFIFPPLILYFFYKVSKRKSFWYILGGSLSFAGLIVSHNAMSLLFLPVVLFYGVYLYFLSTDVHKRSFLLNAAIILLLGFGLSAFFWLPAFVEGKYTLRDIVTNKEVLSRFVSFGQLMYGTWNYGGTGIFSVQVGIVQWIFVVLSLPLTLFYYKKNDKNYLLVSALFLLFCVSLFLMTEGSRIIWEKVSLLQKFQFPWRILSLSIFFAATLGAFVFSAVSKKYHKIFLAIFIILILFLYKDYWHPQGYLQKPESYYSGVYNGTTDTGESAPIWSVRFMEKKPIKHSEVFDGEAKIQELERKTTIHKYAVLASKKTIMRENTLYFPGWKVLVNGSEVPVQFQDPHNRGLITYVVEKGKNDVFINFTETKLRLLADWFSVVSLFTLLILGILRKKVWPA